MIQKEEPTAPMTMSIKFFRYFSYGKNKFLSDRSSRVKV